MAIRSFQFAVQDVCFAGSWARWDSLTKRDPQNSRSASTNLCVLRESVVVAERTSSAELLPTTPLARCLAPDHGMRRLLLAAAAVAATAQDPAEGWLGYAQAVSPTGAGRITFAEAYWVNLQNPVEGGAFWSPWFGVETSDNLNLLQPVNPWVGDSYEIYNEYFQ